MKLVVAAVLVLVAMVGLAGRVSVVGATSPKTPSNQPALDAAANYARHVAGAGHFFAGVAIDDFHNQVILHLVHAPQSVIDELQRSHPNTYVIDNNAPRAWSTVSQLQRSLDWGSWHARGIDIVMTGPTEDGHLDLGVTTDIANAQAAFDAKYGPGVIRVVHAEPAMAASATGTR